MELEHDESHGPRPEYHGSPWVELHTFQPSSHQSAGPEFHGYGFLHTSHGLVPEPPLNHTNPPMAPMQSLRPLVLPTWPNTLPSQSTYAAPMLPTLPMPTPILPPSGHQTASGSTPRRTLTDDDRRRMCLYHEEHPMVKQTEIGAMFGVERSTVSKVLRNKEKYLYPDDGSRSPIKRPSKGKLPDIERALSNWVRNSQRKGVLVTESMIEEKARFFANTVGNSESSVKVNSRSWLEKFKQKNNLTGTKSPKQGAEAGDREVRQKLDSPSASQTPDGASPISPQGVSSPAQLSSTRSHESLKTESPDSYVDFSSGYRLCNSQSATSLSSVFTDATPSSFSAGPTSPTTPYFTTDATCGPPPFLPSQQAQLSTMNNYNRSRSQTFPTVGMDPSVSTSRTPPDNLTPKYVAGHSTSDSSLLDSPNPSMNRNQSNTERRSPSSMQPPPPPPSLNTINAIYVPTTESPTQEEARRALEVVMTFVQQESSGLVDQHEYMTIGKLLEKLRLQGHGLAGGLHQIPEHDGLNSVP